MSSDVFLLVFARTLGLCAVLPFERIGNGGFIFRFSLSFLIAFLLWPTLQSSTAELLFPALIGEFLIGALIAAPGALLVECGSMCGELFDSGRGQTIGSILDPASQAAHSYTAFLGREVCIVWLFVSGAFESLVISLQESLRVFPPNTLSLSTYQQLGIELSRCLSSSVIGVMGAIIPFAFLFMSVEITAALIGKVAPVSLSGEAFIAKSTLGSLALISLIAIEGTEGISALFFEFNLP